MQLHKHVGKYNIIINDGHLDRKSNVWHYQLIVDRFDDEDEWIDSNVFYIVGHKDGNYKEETQCHMLIDAWLHNASEEDIDKVFTHKRNYKFQIVKPTLVDLI